MRLSALIPTEYQQIVLLLFALSIIRALLARPHLMLSWDRREGHDYYSTYEYAHERYQDDLIDPTLT